MTGLGTGDVCGRPAYGWKLDAKLGTIDWYGIENSPRGGMPPNEYLSGDKPGLTGSPEILLGVNADLTELSKLFGIYADEATSGIESFGFVLVSISDCELNI